MYLIKWYQLVVLALCSGVMSFCTTITTMTSSTRSQCNINISLVFIVDICV